MFTKIFPIVVLFLVLCTIPSLLAQRNMNSAKDSITKSTTPENIVKDITVPTGTKFTITISNQLATNKSFEGSTFSASLTDDFRLDTVVVSPKNSLVIGKIIESKRGQGLGDALLSIQVTEITINDQMMSVDTDPIVVKGERKRNAEAEIPAGTIEEITLKNDLVIK